MPTPVVLSYGMGVDSTAILLRWLEEPKSRDFDLSDLVIITAQVGDEWNDTRRLVEKHILPRLRAKHFRYVQLARGGASDEAGIAVLDDTRSPRRVYTEGGPRPLSDELLHAGTVPLVRKGGRRCSIKYKGWVIDTWLRKEFGDGKFRQIIGFNADEQFRVERDQSYTTEAAGSKKARIPLPGRRPEYPLAEWRWGREKVESYVKEVAGEAWAKSCCVFCPFQLGNKEERAGGPLPPAVLERFRKSPCEGRQALLMEMISVTFNPRSRLFSTSSLIDRLHEAGVVGPEQALLSSLQRMSWGIYHLRRIYSAKGRADRSIKLLGIPTDREGAAQILQALADQAHKKVEPVVFGSERVTLQRRSEDTFPTTDEYYVLVPAIVKDKAKGTFEAKWEEEEEEEA